MEHLSDSQLGPSSVAATCLRIDQASANVIPGEAWVTCDWRLVPGEQIESVGKALQGLAGSCLETEEGRVEVAVAEEERVSYTGYRERMPTAHPACLLPIEHPAVRAASLILEETIGQSEPPGVWRFATDGGYFAEAGMTVLGFGPGDEREAHIVGESIAVAELEKGLLGNQALALRLPREAAKRSGE